MKYAMAHSNVILVYTAMAFGLCSDVYITCKITLSNGMEYMGAPVDGQVPVYEVCNGPQ